MYRYYENKTSVIVVLRNEQLNVTEMRTLEVYQGSLQKIPYTFLVVCFGFFNPKSPDLGFSLIRTPFL